MPQWDMPVERATTTAEAVTELRCWCRARKLAELFAPPYRIACGRSHAMSKLIPCLTFIANPGTFFTWQL